MKKEKSDALKERERLKAEIAADKEVAMPFLEIAAQSP
jgi:hypothetical protein